MQLITGITSEPKQSISIPLPSGDSFTLNLRFRPQQRGWFYDISYSTKTTSFVLNGRRLVRTPNLLRQFKDIIPFGILLFTKNGVEPTSQTDFTDGTITALLLDQADIADIERDIYIGANRLNAINFTSPPIVNQWVPGIVDPVAGYSRAILNIRNVNNIQDDAWDFRANDILIGQYDGSGEANIYFSANLTPGQTFTLYATDVLDNEMGNLFGVFLSVDGIDQISNDSVGGSIGDTINLGDFTT